MNMFDPERIRQNLKNIAKEIHVAGTPEQLNLMNRLEKQVYFFLVFNKNFCFNI